MREPARLRQAGLLVAGSAASVAYVALSPGDAADAIYLATVFTAAVLGLVGTRRAAPGHRLVPGLITAGLAGSAVGDLLWLAIAWAGEDPSVSVADVPYFASYLGVGGALLVILMRSRPDESRWDVDAAIDVLTVLVVSVIVLWSVSIRGIIEDGSISVFDRLVLATYPILDGVLLALVLRVVSGAGTGRSSA